VCLSSALWKNGRSGPDAVWHGRSDGSTDGAGSGPIVDFGDRSTGRDNFGGKYGEPHCNKWRLSTIGNSHCASARLLLEFLELQAGEACRLRPSARCS